MNNNRNPRVVIVGAGMSGLCIALKLRQAGVNDITIFEKADDLGGTWRDNTYPGLFCDVPSRTYQYTFALRPEWRTFFAPGPEIHRYFGDVAHRGGLLDSIRFGTEVASAEYTDDGQWRVRTSAGDESEADFLIIATGVLRIPNIPDIPGLSEFSGEVFHSARWDHTVPPAGKRIAVIGTGSTGAQIVSALAGVADELKLFQRTPQWVLPLPNPRYTKLGNLAHRSVPGLDRLSYYGYRTIFDLFSDALIRPGWRRTVVGNLCRAHLHTIRDPELRRALTPDYQPMCKRLVVSADFYRAVKRENVDVITERIDHVEPRGIVTADGALHRLDIIALATGFDAHAYLRPMTLIGRGGVALDDLWRDGPRAYNTVSLPGFPNCFMMIGPHSPVGNYALTAIAESQADHIRHWIRRWRLHEFDSVAPTFEATERYNRQLRASMPRTVWATGCSSWYLGKDGLPEVWPWTPAEHRRRLSRPKADDYDLRGGTGHNSIGTGSDQSTSR